eukprot:SAG31_NODE_122_length_23797_cov_39.343812_5_plen_325_part_00
MEVGDVGLSAQEMRSQVALWAFMNVPMLISTDLRKLLSAKNDETLKLLTNEGILKLQSDPIGYQGRRLPRYAPAPNPSPPRAHEVVVSTCTGKPSQRWRVADDGALIHTSTGLALTIVDCISKHTRGTGAAVALAPRSNNSKCNGFNQLWQLNSNGSITSRMDSSCLDRNANGNYVQAHFCVKDPEGSGGPPTSEAWLLDGGKDNAVIRFGKGTWDQCMEGDGDYRMPRQDMPTWEGHHPVSDGEVWEKQLFGGDVAILLLNRGDHVINISANFQDIPGLDYKMGKEIIVRDVWSARDDGMARSGIWRMVLPHGVVVLRLSSNV